MKIMSHLKLIAAFISLQLDKNIFIPVRKLAAITCRKLGFHYVLQCNHFIAVMLCCYYSTIRFFFQKNDQYFRRCWCLLVFNKVLVFIFIKSISDRITVEIAGFALFFATGNRPSIFVYIPMCFEGKFSFYNNRTNI